MSRTCKIGPSLEVYFFFLRTTERIEMYNTNDDEHRQTDQPNTKMEMSSDFTFWCWRNVYATALSCTVRFTHTNSQTSSSNNTFVNVCIAATRENMSRRSIPIQCGQQRRTIVEWFFILIFFASRFNNFDYLLLLLLFRCPSTLFSLLFVRKIVKLGQPMCMQTQTKIFVHI